MKRKLIAAIGIAGMMVSIAACGDSDGGSSDNTGADAKELTVWLTVDAQNNWPELVKAADATLTKAHPGIKINHEYYGWPDKNAKLDAVLATDKAPDVVEMGNTEMLGYMVKGAFAPSTRRSSRTPPTGWTASRPPSPTTARPTASPTTPVAASPTGARTWRLRSASSRCRRRTPNSPPTWTRSRRRRAASTTPGTSPPATGTPVCPSCTTPSGSIAEESGGQWKATLSSPESVKGLTEFRHVIDKYMHGDKTKDESDRYIVYGQGKTSMIFAAAWEGATAETPENDKTGKLKGNTENFVMPGPSGKNMPVFLGGSDLAVPVKSKAQTVAAEWINAYTGASGQKGLMAKGNLPNNKTDLATLKNDPATAVPATAAESNWFVPMAPGWGQVEKAQILQTLLQNIGTGKETVEAAAKEADAAIDKVINTK